MGDELNLKFKTVSYRCSAAIFSVTSFWDKYARDTDCLHYIQKTHVQVIRKKNGWDQQSHGNRHNSDKITTVTEET